MTDQEYIDAIVSMTKNGRWRDLLNPSHPDYNPKYWAVARAKVDGTSSLPDVIRIAVATPSEYPSLAESVAMTKAMNACPFRHKHPPCGCHGARCSLRNHAIVSHVDCFACLRQYGSE